MKTEPTYNKKNKTFNPTAYYMEYLKLDCLVLKKGLVEFNSLINRITFNQEIFDKSEVDTTMEVWDSLTISSLTDKYMINMAMKVFNKEEVEKVIFKALILEILEEYN